MKVKLNKVRVVNSLECGDVVFVNGNPYLVISTGDGYIAKGFDGQSGSTGHHETLELLHTSLKSHQLEHFSKKDYELVVQRKTQN
jgi:hypothetical protein